MKTTERFLVVTVFLIAVAIVLLVMRTAVPPTSIHDIPGEIDAFLLSAEDIAKQTINAPDKFLYKRNFTDTRTSSKSSSPPEEEAHDGEQCVQCYYEPFEILPEPKPVDRVEIEPVRDVFGKDSIPYRECVHIAIVICGDKMDEARVMLKSAVLLSQSCLVVHVFAEDHLHESISSLTHSWPEPFRGRTHIYVYPITFPTGENSEDWKRVSKLCTTQRLFLPDLLPNVDSILYVDLDVIFVKPIETTWALLDRFTATEFASATEEFEQPCMGFYNRYARHPFYGRTGLNAGIILMNLTRMREARFSNHILSLYTAYRCKFRWPDQDLINLFFYYYPETLFESPCSWNYRRRHCVYGETCESTKTDGISMLHGTSGSFHSGEMPSFQAVYDAYRDFPLGGSISRDLVKPMKEKWLDPSVNDLPCTKTIRTSVLSTLIKYQNVSGNME